IEPAVLEQAIKHAPGEGAVRSAPLQCDIDLVRRAGIHAVDATTVHCNKRRCASIPDPCYRLGLILRFDPTMERTSPRALPWRIPNEQFRRPFHAAGGPARVRDLSPRCAHESWRGHLPDALLVAHPPREPAAHR